MDLMKNNTVILSVLVISLFLCVFNAYAEESEPRLTMSYSDVNAEMNVIKNNGSLWSCSIDEETGKPGKFEKIMDNVKSVSGNYAIKEDNSLWTWGYNLFTDKYEEEPIKVMYDIKEVSEIVTYETYLLILKNDNSLWGIGSNCAGQLAQGEFDQKLGVYIPDNFNKPVKIMDDVKKAAGSYMHSIVLKEDGSVWIVGGGYGMGMSGGETTNVPVNIMNGAKNVFAGANSSFVIEDDENSTSWRWGIMCPELAGIAGNWPKTPVKYVENIKKILPCSGYSVILKNDNTLWLCGQGDKAKEGNAEDGIFLDASIKIADDIDNFTDYSGGVDKILILHKNGELYTLLFDCFDLEYTIAKITDDVCLSKAVPDMFDKFTVITTETGITVALNNTPVTFPDAKPFVDENNRTQIPVRALAELLDFNVRWNGDTLTAELTKGDTVVTIKIGENQITKNGETIEMDTAAKVVNDRTYIPLRFVGEALGCNVEWEN